MSDTENSNPAVQRGSELGQEPTPQSGGPQPPPFSPPAAPAPPEAAGSTTPIGAPPAGTSPTAPGQPSQPGQPAQSGQPGQPPANPYAGTPQGPPAPPPYNLGAGTPGGGGSTKTALIILGIVSALVLVAIVAIVVVVVAVSGSESGVVHKPVSSATPMSLDSLQGGDCFIDPPSIRDMHSTVTVVPCNQPHDREVFGTFDLSGSTYPGDSAVDTQASHGCDARIAGYVGNGAPAWVRNQQVRYYRPLESSWSTNKLVVCMAATSSPSTRSIYQSGN